MKGYAYIENGIVVVNEKRKPRSVGQVNSYYDIVDFLKAQNDVKEWEDSCYEVENTVKIKGDKAAIHPENKYLSSILGIIESGQPVDFDEKTCKITEIL